MELTDRSELVIMGKQVAAIAVGTAISVVTSPRYAHLTVVKLDQTVLSGYDYAAVTESGAVHCLISMSESLEVRHILMNAPGSIVDLSLGGWPVTIGGSEVGDV